MFAEDRAEPRAPRTHPERKSHMGVPGCSKRASHSQHTRAGHTDAEWANRRGDSSNSGADRFHPSVCHPTLDTRFRKSETPGSFSHPRRKIEHDLVYHIIG